MFLIDLVKRRANVVRQESEGINLATYYINKFAERRFTFKGLKKKHTGLSADDLLKMVQQEIDSTLVLYRYTTKVKEFADRKGVAHARIKLIGRASKMSRYNPLDIKLDIKTERP